MSCNSSMTWMKAGRSASGGLDLQKRKPPNFPAFTREISCKRLRIGVAGQRKGADQGASRGIEFHDILTAVVGDPDIRTVKGDLARIPAHVVGADNHTVAGAQLGYFVVAVIADPDVRLVEGNSTRELSNGIGA